MPIEKIEKKDYNRSLTHRELELILEIIKPLSLRLTPENQRILGRATTKLQKLFDEQNPKNKPQGPSRKQEHVSEIQRIAALGPVDWLHGRRGK